MNRAKVTVLVALVAGCASVTDVVSTGQGTYLVASQGVSGNGSGAAQKVSAIQAAEKYCQTHGGKMQVVKAEQTEPMFGRSPSAQVEFRCTNS